MIHNKFLQAPLGRLSQTMQPLQIRDTRRPYRPTYDEIAAMNFPTPAVISQFDRPLVDLEKIRPQLEAAGYLFVVRRCNAIEYLYIIRPTD